MTCAIDKILSQRKILITCGTGGVGKTTISAALAIRATLLGKKTAVITIDPAKRLATSLGLQTLGDHPTDLTDTIHQSYANWKLNHLPSSEDANLGKKRGSLVAITPHTRHSFENFVRELATHPATVERILRNPIFQIFSREFSGTNEYMALERLFSLEKQGQYDCIILDTPPSRNTLAFLDAPKLLAQFFEERLIRWLILPTNKLVSAGMRKTLGMLEKLTGAGFMTSLVDFATALFEVQVKFQANLKKVTALLGSQQVGFLMVSTLTPDSKAEVEHFIQSLKNHHFHLDGLLINRTLSYLKESKQDSSYPTAHRLIQALQAQEKEVLTNLMQNPIPVCATLPELARDVHSVEDLIHVAMALGETPFGTLPLGEHSPSERPHPSK